MLLFIQKTSTLFIIIILVCIKKVTRFMTLYFFACLSIHSADLLIEFSSCWLSSRILYGASILSLIAFFMRHLSRLACKRDPSRFLSCRIYSKLGKVPSRKLTHMSVFPIPTHQPSHHTPNLLKLLDSHTKVFHKTLILSALLHKLPNQNHTIYKHPK